MSSIVNLNVNNFNRYEVDDEGKKVKDIVSTWILEERERAETGGVIYDAYDKTLRSIYFNQALQGKTVIECKDSQNTPLGLLISGKDGECLEIGFLVVRRGNQGKRIGQSLVEQLLKGNDKDIKVCAYNRAVCFYKKMGFEVLEDKNNGLTDMVLALSKDQRLAG